MNHLNIIIFVIMSDSNQIQIQISTAMDPSAPDFLPVPLPTLSSALLCWREVDQPSTPFKPEEPLREKQLLLLSPGMQNLYTTLLFPKFQSTIQRL